MKFDVLKQMVSAIIDKDDLLDLGAPCEDLPRLMRSDNPAFADGRQHQEVLRRVFGPATNFDKPILDFANPSLARLVKFGIKSVVWETPECAKGRTRCVLKPIDNDDQEPLLEFLGMSLYNIYICLSFY